MCARAPFHGRAIDMMARPPSPLRALCVAGVPAPATQTSTLEGLGFNRFERPRNSAKEDGRSGGAQKSPKKKGGRSVRRQAARRRVEVVLLKHHELQRPCAAVAPSTWRWFSLNPNAQRSRPTAAGAVTHQSPVPSPGALVSRGSGRAAWRPST